MYKNGMKVVLALAFAAGVPLLLGCANQCSAGERRFSLTKVVTFPVDTFRTVVHRDSDYDCPKKCKTTRTACADCRPLMNCKSGCGDRCGHGFATASYKSTTHATTDLPPNAVPGECYAKVFVPPQFKTVSERVCVKEATEKVDIIPAQYEWVEEKVCVKEASKQLIEEPAQFESYTETVVVEPGRTDWVRESAANCTLPGGHPANAQNEIRDVFCLVNYPPMTKEVTKQRMIKPVTCHEVVIPAEYQTVRRQKLVCPAQVKKSVIPAEFDMVERTVKCADGYMKWERVVCDIRTQAGADKVVEVKRALAAAGYDPGPINGEINEEYRESLTQYQEDNNLGVGELTFETVEKLGLSDKYILTSGR